VTGIVVGRIRIWQKALFFENSGIGEFNLLEDIDN